MPTNALLKHIKLVKSYARLNFKKMTEYKFNVVTNAVGFVVLIISWAWFWNLLFGNIKDIGEWKYPMLLLLVGFVNLSNSLWQMCWYTIAFAQDINKGTIDLYLVRPVHPLYGLVMKEFQLFSLFPVLFGSGIIAYTLFTYYSPAVLNIFIALLICVFAVAIIHTFYAIINSLAFWFGKISAIRTIFRSFSMIQNYPIDIFSIAVQNFFTFLVPFYFFGTAQVIVLLKSSVAQGLYYLALVIGVFLFWFAIFLVVWNRGVKKYESYGG